MSLSIDADISADTDLLGKSVTDLQEGVSISGGTISGTLHYVEGYTGFSGDPAEQEGNYIALHAEDESATSIAIKPLGSTAEPAALDPDGLYILHIVKATGIEVYTVKNGVTYRNVYRFENLIREPKEED